MSKRQRYPRQRMRRNCAKCGRSFKAYRITGRYCSDNCRRNAWYARKKGK